MNDQTHYYHHVFPHTFKVHVIYTNICTKEKNPKQNQIIGIFMLLLKITETLIIISPNILAVID